MVRTRHKVELTQDELEVITSALHTQEKILAVQSRAGGDPAAEARLGELRSVLDRLNGKLGAARPLPRMPVLGWFGRSRFG